MEYRRKGVWVMAALYILAGLNHFIHPEFYLKIVPGWLPAPYAIIFISGVFEIAGGMLVFNRKTRRAGAWLIIAILIAVYPANIKMAMDYYQNHNPKFWIAIVRLPIQFVLIWWAWLVQRKS